MVSQLSENLPLTQAVSQSVSVSHPARRPRFASSSSGPEAGPHVESERRLKRPVTAAFIPVFTNFNDDDLTQSFAAVEPRGLKRACAWLRRHLRVETSANLFGGQSLPDRLEYFKNATHTEDGNFVLQENNAKSFGLGNNITAAEIIEMYRDTDLEDKASSVVFVLKLGVALVSYGYCTVDTHHLLQAVCEGVELPVNRIDIIHACVTASFGTGPSHLLNYTEGMQCDKLLASVCLANHVSCGLADVQSAIMLLDEIIERRKPYGWLAHILAFECFCVGASLSLRMGTWEDAKCTSLIAPFVIVMVKLCSHAAGLRQLVDFMAPLATGVGASFVWRFVHHAPACHVPVWYLSLLVDFLPGSQLVYAAYEFEFSSIVNGTTRLVRALLQCMSLAVGLVLGWQVFGYNFIAADPDGPLQPIGVLASLPPSEECNDTAFKNSHWKLYFGAYNIPVLMIIMVGMNIRLRDMLGPLAISYFALLIYAILTYGGLVNFPSIVTNILTIFMAGNLASLNEYFTRTPAVVTVLPVVCFLAPATIF